MPLRRTKLQRMILSILKKNNGPLSVPSLKKYLENEEMSPHKTSLYRNLEKLIEDGSVQEVLLDTSSVYYEATGAHHHHTFCTLCEDISCIASDIVERGVKKMETLAKESGFTSSEHHIVLHGTCRSCQKL